jgi:hypothetical protein
VRVKKRLRFVREETPSGDVVYRAKRKRELAVITPRPRELGGGYDLAVQTDRTKRTIEVATIAEAREAAEAMRYAPAQRNPLALPKMPGPTFWWGAGLGAAVAVGLTVWLEGRANAQTAPLPPALPPGPGVTALLTGAASQSVASGGREVTVSLPSGSQWVSFAGQNVNGSGPITIPAPAAGTYDAAYIATGGGQAVQTMLTVT